MTLELSGVALSTGSKVVPPPVAVSGWSVDSRTVAPGDVFFALRGPNHDGHAYVADAFRRGATAAVVEHEMEASGLLIPVEDSYGALAGVAAWARQQWGGTVVGVTGSAGKTTTKDAIAHLLGSRMPVGKTVGNYNNHVGLPLSILRLADEAKVAVLEIGMNHSGEIRRLAAIARPEIGVVTSVGFAHAENFGSVEEIALAKRELIEALPSGGTAVLNADDERVKGFREVHQGATITFGFAAGADVRSVEVERTETATRFRVEGSGWLETSLRGRHGIRNLLAALAVGCVFGHEPREFADQLASFEASEMRGRRLSHNGITILDDCYNSNPEAVRAMLEVLSETPARRRIAVLGEMLELGRWAEELHRDVGRNVAECGINVLVGLRGAAREMADAAIRAGLPAGAAYFFDEPEQAGEHLKTLAREGDAVLFKGSRGTRVELALKRFLE